MKIAPLDNRTILTLSGAGVRPFLQNLITNDMDKVSDTRAIYAALLTAQGKFLHDFIVVKRGADFLLDCARDRKDDLIRRLTMYKLRADVTIAETGEHVFALFSEGAAKAAGLPEEAGAVRAEKLGLVMIDPRLAAIGVRVIADEGFDPEADFLSAKEVTDESYEAHRLALGIPEGGTDILPEKNFLLEANFEELNGVSFAKGCYVGQELTARTKHRAKIKKRLYQINFDGNLSAGDKITCGEKEVAEVRSFSNGQGLALVRLESFAESEEEELKPAGVRLSEPEYLTSPAPTARTSVPTS